MTEQLRLPALAADLLARTGEPLKDALADITDARGWWLGGGSILAAQWQHRESTDLDIFMPGDLSVAPLDPRWDDGFLKTMRAAGGQTFNVQARSVKIGFPHGRLEITALDAVPALLPRRVTVDGVDLLVLQNASILTGKLYGRGMRMPARDVFDMCVAASEDPAALRCAVNHISTVTRVEVAHLLRQGAARYREHAAEQIPAPAARHRHLLRDAPEMAVELLLSESYAGDHELRCSNGRATVTVRTVGGATTTQTHTTGAALAEAMRGMGLEDAMLGPAGSIAAFVAEIDEELARSTPGGTDGPPQ